MMRNILFYVLIAVTSFAIGCKKDGNPYEGLSREELGKLVSERYDEMRTLASPVPCTDPEEWELAAIEAVCSPKHLAYHQSVDVEKLRELIRDYNLLMDIYGPLVSPFIDCMPHGPVIGVVCENGKAIVQYEPFEAGAQ